MQPCCIEIWLIKAKYDDEKWDAHNISQELQAWIKSTRKIQDHKQVIKSNKVLEEFKARIGRKGNRKHKYLFRGSSHRSTPRLHLCEGFPLSTEDVYKVYQRPEHQTPPLTQTSTEEVSQQDEQRVTSSQVISKKDHKLLYKHFSLYNFLIAWGWEFGSKKCSEKNSVVKWSFLENTTKKSRARKI